MAVPGWKNRGGGAHAVRGIVPLRALNSPPPSVSTGYPGQPNTPERRHERVPQEGGRGAVREARQDRRHAVRPGRIAPADLPNAPRP